MVRLRILLFLIGFSFLALAQNDPVFLSVQTGHSNTITALEFSPDNRWLASAGADNNIVLWDVLKGKQMAILSGHSQSITDISFHPSLPQLASSSMDGTVIIWQLPNGSKVKTITKGNGGKNSVKYNADGSELMIGGENFYSVSIEDERTLIAPDIRNVVDIQISGSTGKIALATEKMGLILTSFPDFRPQESFRGRFYRSHFSDDGEEITAAGIRGNMRKWQVDKKGFLKRLNISAQRAWHSYFDVDINESFFAGANKDQLIYVHKRKSGKLIHVLKGHTGEVRALALSTDGKILASAGRDKKILLWDLANGELITRLEGIGKRINDIFLGESGSSMILGYDDGTIRHAMLNEQGQYKSLDFEMSRLRKYLGWEYSISHIESYREEEGIVDFMLTRRKRGKSLKVNFSKTQSATVTWNIRSGEYILHKFYGFSRRNDTFLHEGTGSLSLEGKIVKYQLSNGLKGEILTNHTDKITTVALNPKFNQIITASWDGLVKFWNISESNESLSFASFNDSDYIYVDHENYYSATKGALDGIGFLVEEQLFSFDQFDTKYNRPDIVFSNLPWITEDLVRNFRLAYEKRLEKLGVDENDLEVSTDIPHIQIDRSSITPVTRERALTLDFSAIDKNGLRSVHVIVNGVPEFGKNGKIVSGRNWNANQLSITLNPGVNDIQLYAMNEKGATSFRENVQVNCLARNVKPELYLITIGTSEFQQSEYNLKYAAKDAYDIMKFFENDKDFNQVHSMILVNQEVTKERLMEIDAFLKPAKEEDVVIISVAGHGVLDTDLDYYLSTYDMDFQNPSERGLAYEELESYLDRTRSRKKTLFVDACHSGELDKSEVELSFKKETEFGEINFRNAGPTVEYKASSMSLKSSFELSRMLFADMRANNGATVISSAGGAEYAVEGSEWNNGVFTFALLNGLKTEASDLNKDGKIMLSELQRYLFTEVPRITNGKQTPTSRVENLNNDFQLK